MFFCYYFIVPVKTYESLRVYLIFRAGRADFNCLGL